jgi:predicted nucleic acid-binding protein
LKPLLVGKLVAFDTGPLIYYIEEHPVYLIVADELFEAFDTGVAQGVTSVLTLQEVLVRPLRDGRHDLAEKYRNVLSNARNIRLQDIDQSICETAAELRAKYLWLRTPDALQLATAIKLGVDILVTNDDRWRLVSEVAIFVLKDFV